MASSVAVLGVIEMQRVGSPESLLCLRRRGHGTQLPERRLLVAAVALVQAARPRAQERRHGHFVSGRAAAGEAAS